jgi:hypothetical protein
MGASVPNGLTRREFVRRAGLLGLASVAFGRSLAKRYALATEAGSDLPMLTEPGVVTALAARSGRVTAFLMGPAGMSVWGLSDGDLAWRLLADASALPPDATIAEAVALDSRTIAVGATHDHIEPTTVVDLDGNPIENYVHLTKPLIVSSSDQGVTWDVLLNDALGAPGAALYCVEEFADGSLIAIGSEFPEIDVNEHVDFFALRSDDAGTSWNRIDLPGLAPVYHGQPLSMSRVGDSVLLVTLSLHWTDFYVATTPDSWTSIRPPSPSMSPTSFLGAAAVGDSWLVTGVDQSGRLAFWSGSLRQGSSVWRPIPVPLPLAADSVVHELLAIDGQVVAAGSDGSESIVTAVEVQP